MLPNNRLQLTKPAIDERTGGLRGPTTLVIEIVVAGPRSPSLNAQRGLRS
jgi:hypothetical protein